MGERYDLIVLGAGSAARDGAAKAAGDFGARVAMVERERWGGSCPNVACRPTKAYLLAAELVHDLERDEPAVEPERFRGPEEPWPGHWSAHPRAFPEERLLAAETRDVIQDAIDKLPETQRSVITLRDVEGWSADEVCNALTLSETNQRVLLHRARSAVRAALERYMETR